MNQVIREPNLTEEELTLALDIYLTILDEGSALRETNPRIIELSKVLNSLAIHPTNKRNTQFRNPDGVRRRLHNFSRLAGGQILNGLLAYTNIWKRYSQDNRQLKTEVARILQQYSQSDTSEKSCEEMAADIEEIKKRQNITETEKAALTWARKGQGDFRSDLIKIWGRCLITGCDQLEMLRASHIKPWRCSNDEERLDPYNGLLLVPNLDLLFDKGYISFDDEGNILISQALSANTKKIFNIHSDISLKLNQTQLTYMSFHRNNIFRH